jgi:outer membrane immunogenic protein
MRKFALAVAALAIGTVTASAADMAARPYVKAPAPIAAVYNWTGFYVGGHVGWGEAKQDWFLIQNAVGFGFSKDGVIAGGYAGYNWQLGSNFVLGAEFEGSWSDLQQGNVPCTIGQAAICRNDVNWLGSVRGRAGVAFNQVLFYAAGGWAFADASHDRQFLPLGGGPFTSGVSDTRDGWVAGRGRRMGVRRQLDWSRSIRPLRLWYQDLSHPGAQQLLGYQGFAHGGHGPRRPWLQVLTLNSSKPRHRPGLFVVPCSQARIGLL